MSAKLTSAQVNDRLFLAFPAGWFAGVISGAVYAGFHWTNLQVELGRTLLVAVTTSQLVTLAIVTIIVRRIYPRRRRSEGRMIRRGRA